MFGARPTTTGVGGTVLKYPGLAPADDVVVGRGVGG